ncbi:MAG TPA: hypothetical protein VGB53_09530 [Rubricoccaceae bacterium]
MRRCVLALVLFAASPAAVAQRVRIDSAAVLPTDAHLAQIAEAGQLAGEIQACELDWEPYYLGYMQSERRRAANEGRERGTAAYDQRIAFIGTFFGMTQGRAFAAFQGKPCPDDHLPALGERMHTIAVAARERETVSGGK